MSTLRTAARASSLLASRRPTVAAQAFKSLPRCMSIDAQNKLLAADLKNADPTVYDIVEKEKRRQKHFINLIPSENFTSQAVLDALGSVMQSMLGSRYKTLDEILTDHGNKDKYSEGYPGARYYGGNEHIDEAERLCQQRALETFGLNPQEWGVNVQGMYLHGKK